MLKRAANSTVSGQFELIQNIMYVLIACKFNQRTNGPVNAHLISWPSKAQNIQNLENIW